MKVKELKALLEKCVNQEAEINIHINTINWDDENFDIDAELEVSGSDVFTTEHVDNIDLYAITQKNTNQLEMSISTQFENYKRINILLDSDKGLLLVTNADDEKQVLREINMLPKLTYPIHQKKNLLIKKLHNIL